jgi:sulfate transport system substrate-binding protein
MAQRKPLNHRRCLLKKRFLCLLFLVLSLPGCGGEKKSSAANEITLTLGAYTVPKEAYQNEIIPAFQKFWLEKTGQKVSFEESYVASGAQSRAIEGGFEADVAALSLEEDVERLRTAGLITHDWDAGAEKGIVTKSIVVIAFREGNPRDIQDWEDLAQPGLSVLYPNPRTSGGAMWDVNAIYGAGLKMSEVRTGQKDKKFAKELLKSIQKNVKVMDKSGRESMTTFEQGVGDAIVTYENEVLLRRRQGRAMSYVIPDATILIENPAAVVDAYADKHGRREVAEAFVGFLFTEEAQRSFANYGFRPVNSEIAAEFASTYPEPNHVFDIQYLEGWSRVYEEIYGTHGIWTTVIDELSLE